MAGLSEETNQTYGGNKIVKDSTRIRRLIKIWVAWNDETLEPNSALAKISKLFHKETLEAWNKYNNMTDDVRKRFLKEILE